MDGPGRLGRGHPARMARQHRGEGGAPFWQRTLSTQFHKYDDVFNGRWPCESERAILGREDSHAEDEPFFH